MFLKTATWFVAVVCLVSTVRAQPTIIVPQNAAEQNPDAVLRAFVHAINDNDFEGASRLVQGGQKGAALEQAKAEIQKARGSYIYEVREISLNFEGAMQELALAKIRLRLKDTLNNKITHDERLILKNMGNFWRIVPLSPESLRHSVYENSDSDILQILASYLAQPKEITEIRAQKCMMHLKQLSLAALQFLQDWDEKYAFKAENYEKALMPYTRNAEVFSCPLNPQQKSYAFNTKLENRLMADVKEAAQTVLFYEGNDGQLNFLHDNRAGVAFADGHVELVTPERAKTLIGEP